MSLRRGLNLLGVLRRPLPEISCQNLGSASRRQGAAYLDCVYQHRGGLRSLIDSAHWPNKGKIGQVRQGDTEMVLCSPWEEEGGSSKGRDTAVFTGFLAAFSLFSKPVEGEKDESSEAEDQIIFLLKKAKLSIMKGELQDAERNLHQALWLAQQSDNSKAITYTYDLMANLAFVNGELSNAETLYKAVMSNLLATDTPQDDNGIIEISLKLAMIYAAQSQHQLAIAGYQFCVLTLEEKIKKEKDFPEEVLTAEEKTDTRLLLGMSLDSYGRYLLANKQLSQAQIMYEKALEICREEQGETHPQTVILMNDLATVMDAQGAYDNAYNLAKKALELARQTEHPDQHVVLGNLAGILMHKESFAEAQQIYKEALKQAQQKGDSATVQHIEEGLAELARKWSS
ncbi:tetratricopeptide repeat protein 19, mitochondrial [Microcaecilia unicolor]|uniref:Tetratricopeptide repeat protein 19, mitochondrial n=1 Tax=Microcaecilia unicolor TaxID=1415580 RepID=A0A6P7WVC9_9AMPH|nr:tetratricopeptide repeat protein 19, mitochondrial [Microcaecilia unicolor]